MMKREAYRHAVNKVDDEVEQLAKMITEAKKIPIVIGGGHNNTYPLIKGTAKGWHKAGMIALAQINCINVWTLLEDAAHTAATAAEDLAKDFERIVKTASTSSKSTRAGSPSQCKGCMPIPVIGRALLFVGKNVVGFANLLELFLRGFVSRVPVRGGNPAPGELAVGFLQFLPGKPPLSTPSTS